MKKILLLISVLAFIKCAPEPQGKELFYGKWRGARWTIDGFDTGGIDPAIIKFEFKKISKDSSFYSANFGSIAETGSFNLNNDCFNAMSIYKSPKKCPILQYGKDTMIWMMDSVQQQGHLHLVREKE